MDTVTKLAMFLVAGEAAAAGDGPTGPPTVVTTEAVGFPLKIRVMWVNGDPLAYTRVYRKSGSCAGASTLWGTANPGLTSFDTGIADATHGFTCSHYRNGQESAESDCWLHTAGEE